MKILIVEDEICYQDFIHKYLSHLGYTLYVTGCAAEALKCYQQQVPDLILVDVCMPGMNGYELVHKIREIEAEWIPIIFLSAKVSSQDIVKGIEAGADDYITKPVEPDILKAKMQAMLRIYKIRNILKQQAKELKDQNIKLEQLQQEKIYQASHDLLTALPNRQFFEMQLGKAIVNANNKQEKLAVMFLDLDGFKSINDSLGHKMGDDLLKKIANKLSSIISNTDLIARFGGDEFIILLPKVDDSKAVVRIAQIVLAVLSEPFFINNQTHILSVSIGIALMPEDGNDVASLIQNSDTAMSYAKKHGKNNYKFHTKELDNQAKEYHSIVTDLKVALKKEQFMLHFQPQVDFEQNKIISAETLVRWHHPVKGFISPAKFIPIAEEVGLISLIDRMVFYKLCKQLTDARNILDENFVMAFNVSVKDLMHDQFIDSLYYMVSKYALNPSTIQLELTESIFINDLKTTLHILQKIKSKGFTIALDDFGTGYACLSQLAKLPIDMLKIDKSFINELDKDSKKKVLVKTLIAMGKSLNIKVLAEGVETIEQAKLLASMGCTLMQGFLFSKAVSFDCLLEKISNYNANGLQNKS